MLLENFIINPEKFSMVNHTKSRFLRILQNFSSHYLRETGKYLKIHTYEGNQH